MYKLISTKAFRKKAKKILTDKKLQDSFLTKLKILENNPFDLTLKTHKVQSKKFRIMYASKITNDIRLIWNFDQNNTIIILLLDIGGYEGKNKVYK